MSLAMQYVLVTGTNGGLGLGICTRLLDDFLRTQPQSSSLTLIFTTRSTRKGTDTLRTLQAHLSKTHPATSQQRIHLQPENVELTNLLSIRALAHKLLASDIPHLNAIICNAGIGGWAGLNWSQAVLDMLTHPVLTTAWPRFKLGIKGLVTEKQFPDDTLQQTTAEPPIAQVFCANVFGHYMLAHWLMPLLRACDAAKPSRLIWVGSIEPSAKHFNEDDLMALHTSAAYESTKRLTDILALTANSPATRQPVEQFMSVDTNKKNRTVRSTPTIHVGHPGTCTTSIVPLYWIVHQGYILGVHMARVLGNPWATVYVYLAASVFSWLAFASADEIDGKEAQFGNGGGGRVKWGASSSRLGTPSIRPTDVQHWGINGSGEVFAKTWWAASYGRMPGAVDATKEDVDDFVALGGRVWNRMENLRMEWERRIDEFERAQEGQKK